MLLLLGTGEGIGVTSLLSATPNAWNAISGQVFANSDAVRGNFEFVIGGLIPGETVSSVTVTMMTVTAVIVTVLL
jgi:hypothetical protein